MSRYHDYQGPGPLAGVMSLAALIILSSGAALLCRLAAALAGAL